MMDAKMTLVAAYILEVFGKDCDFFVGIASRELSGVSSLSNLDAATQVEFLDYLGRSICAGAPEVLVTVPTPKVSR